MGRGSATAIAAVALVSAAAARGDGAAAGASDVAPAAAGEVAARATAPGASSCELSRVTDRSRVSSLRCVACHDGSIGPGVSFVMGPGQSMDHPVEVDYARAAGGDRRFVPAETLPADVPLVDGKVACTSCHDGRSPDPKHVAVPLTLCQTCHRL